MDSKYLVEVVCDEQCSFSPMIKLLLSYMPEEEESSSCVMATIKP
jgi:hypothetical protein